MWDANHRQTRTTYPSITEKTVDKVLNLAKEKKCQS